MNAKQIAKEFVLPYFNLHESFFNAAWDYVSANFDKVSAALSSGKRIVPEKMGMPLAFGGDEERGSLRAILIFADGFKEMPLKAGMSGLVDSIKFACEKYHAEEGLTKEILKKVSSLENRIAKFMEPAERIKSAIQSKEKEEYELIFSGGKKKFITFQKAGDIRDKKGSGSKKEIFIDDERKEAFFNKKLINEFKGQMYAMLMHFVMNEGVGGNALSLYKSIWGGDIADENDIENAVHQAIRRFRATIKKNGIGDVPEISKSVYSASKTYILKPRPQYYVLRRIEKEKKNISLV